MTKDPDYFNQGQQQDIKPDVVDIPTGNKIPDGTAPGEVLNEFIPHMYYFTENCDVYKKPGGRCLGKLGSNVRLKITEVKSVKDKTLGYSKNRKLWIDITDPNMAWPCN